MISIATNLKDNSTTVKVTNEELEKIAKLTKNEFYIFANNEWMHYTSFLNM